MGIEWFIGGMRTFLCHCGCCAFGCGGARCEVRSVDFCGGLVFEAIRLGIKKD
jgi:hypothetical protein